MRILVVDDDASVVQALLATLKTLPGHEVRAAMSGEKAIENATAWGGIDLLISDVVMEPMDGFTLRDQMLLRCPAMQTIFISGYDLSDYPEQTQNHQVLTKPIDAATLRAAVTGEAERATIAPAAVAAPASAPAAQVAAPAPVHSPIAVPAGQPGIAAAAPAARSAAPVMASQPWVTPGAVPKVAATAAPVARPAAAAPQPRIAAPAAVAHPVAQPAVTPAEESAPNPSVEQTGDSPEETALTDPAEAESAAPEDNLIGQTLGTYQVTGRLGEGKIGTAYTAVQVTINRPVVLKMLDPIQQLHEPTRRRFIADARAKAHVQHPSIVPVYEAGEAAGRIFYAREYVDGQNLAELQASGAKIDEATGLKVMRAVAEGLAYLRLNNIPHAPLEPASIYLTTEGHPRLANLATQISEQPQTVEQEIQALARMMLGVLPAAQQLSPGVRILLGRMVQASTTGLNAWGVLLAGLKALEPKVVPVEAAKISAQDRAAIEAVELARKQQRKSLWLNIASLATLFAIVVYLVLWKFVFTNERKIQGEVLIPAGTYKNASGKTVEIAQPFLIDAYEVTFAQYGRFLDYLEEHPTADQDFRDPRMPRHITHTPENWNIYFLRAKAGQPVRSIPIDLNCPVIMVTWWDAYAYARWLGRELPTADEWEIAATGGKEQKYPWGNEAEAAKANSGVDHLPNNPPAKGKVDGYNFWNPVDAIRGDKSPFGVVGMAGNVSEWTGSWTPERRPIIKGGSYRDSDVPLDKQVVDRDPSKGEEFIGFRTIKRNPTK